MAECRTLHGCETGQAKITKGYKLPAKYVIHTPGPIWKGGGHGEAELLASCYRSSLTLAVEHSCRTVIVCSGAHHRELGLADEKRLQGRGVSYCALCDGNFFRNAPVAVVGGGNAALEESLYLAKLASKVYLIHRRDEFRGAKIYQDKLESMPDKVELVRSSVVTALHGENALTSLSVRDLKTDEIRQISVEGLFIYVGFEPATAYLPAALERDAQGFIVTDTEMRTSIPGIFAAGDVRSKLCRQVITAAGDGATAAQAAFVFLEQLHV